MKPIKTVTIDLNRPQRNVVQMVQGDTSRRVLVNLLLNGVPYNVITDYSGTIVKGVQYIKANGIGGYYEETTTGDDAVTAGTNANQWIVAIDNHATDVPGFAECFVKFSTEDGYVLHSFPITLYVDQSAASGGTDPNEPYYQSASFLIAGNQAAKTADMTSPVGVDENGKMWVAPDNSFTLEAKTALLELLSHVAYIDQNGQDYYDALELALRAKLSYIVADYVQDHTVYDTDSLDVLKEGDDLIVTAFYDDGSHIDLADSQYTLSGTLTAGTSTITATYGGKTATFTVTVTHADAPREYTAYDYIAYIGSDVTDANAENNVHTAVYADLNAYVIEFDFSPLVAKTTATAICGGQYGTGNTKNVTFYARTDTHRVSAFSHGTAIGIDNNTNVAVGSVAHVKLDPGSASPSTLFVDEASQTGAWTNTNAVNAPIGYCGGIRQDNAKLNVYKFAGIGILTLKDLSGTLVGKYIPVKRNADNVMGIYDIVEGVFHTASNTALVTQGDANCVWEVGNWS